MFRYYIEPKVIPDLLTEDEIEYIKKKSINKLEPSATFNPSHNSIRQSESTWLKLDDPIVDNVIRKCVGLTNKPIGHCEPLQVTRYKTGGFYKPHQDTSERVLTNKRLYTIMIALNDDYEGGETSFPNLNIKYKLKKGDALFFHTLDNYELHTSMALHGGEPVKSGEKWICNLWVHKYPHN
tara:strand:- start:45 stop:587 length:543 start_codon:yes stop_codon:yes gene_type:complete